MDRGNSVSSSHYKEVMPMSRAISGICLLVAVLLSVVAGSGQQTATRFNYLQLNGALINNGMQALFICNGLFVSNRTMDQLYGAELKMNQMPLALPDQMKVDRERKTVAVGDGISAPVMRAAQREGIGCVVMGPEQTFADVDKLPILKMPPLPGDPSKTPWPDGDLIETRPLPSYIDRKALDAAADFAFDRVKAGHPSQITLSLLVVHKGDIVLERYAAGVDMTTKTRTWSTAKSIAATLEGIAIGEGKLALDAPLPFKNWGPGRGTVPDSDPRTKITWRSILTMSSGLYPG